MLFSLNRKYFVSDWKKYIQSFKPTRDGYLFSIYYRIKPTEDNLKWVFSDLTRFILSHHWYLLKNFYKYPYTIPFTKLWYIFNQFRRYPKMLCEIWTRFLVRFVLVFEYFDNVEKSIFWQVYNILITIFTCLRFPFILYNILIMSIRYFVGYWVYIGFKVFGISFDAFDLIRTLFFLIGVEIPEYTHLPQGNVILLQWIINLMNLFYLLKLIKYILIDLFKIDIKVIRFWVGFVTMLCLVSFFVVIHPLIMVTLNFSYFMTLMLYSFSIITTSMLTLLLTFFVAIEIIVMIFLMRLLVLIEALDFVSIQPHIQAILKDLGCKTLTSTISFDLFQIVKDIANFYMIITFYCYDISILKQHDEKYRVTYGKIKTIYGKFLNYCSYKIFKWVIWWNKNVFKLDTFGVKVLYIKRARDALVRYMPIRGGFDSFEAMSDLPPSLGKYRDFLIILGGIVLIPFELILNFNIHFMNTVYLEKYKNIEYQGEVYKLLTHGIERVCLALFVATLSVSLPFVFFTITTIGIFSLIISTYCLLYVGILLVVDPEMIDFCGELIETIGIFASHLYHCYTTNIRKSYFRNIDYKELNQNTLYKILYKLGFFKYIISMWLTSQMSNTSRKDGLLLYYLVKGKIYRLGVRDNVPHSFTHQKAIMLRIFSSYDKIVQDSFIFYLGCSFVYSILGMLINTFMQVTVKCCRTILRFLMVFFIVLCLPSGVYDVFRGILIHYIYFIKAIIDNIDFSELRRSIKGWIAFLKLRKYLLHSKFSQRNRNRGKFLDPTDIEFVRKMEYIKSKLHDDQNDVTESDKNFNEENEDKFDILIKISKDILKHEDIKNLNIYKNNWVSLTRNAVKKFVMRLDSFRLPEFIQAQYKSPTPQSLRSSYQFLLDMGFPLDQGFIDSIRAPNDSDYLSEWASYRQWLLANSNFKMGLPKIRAGFDFLLNSFGFENIPGFIHTINFTGKEPEIRSTSRYWTPNLGMDDFSSDDIDDVIKGTYESVKAQYGNPQLSSPEFIFKHWVKRFNVGFGFRIPVYSKQDPTIVKKYRQMKRAYLIEKLGGRKGFLNKFKTLFRYAPSMSSIAPVFTKMETLKLKKAISRSVRTVIGSAFVHHVASTIFNFKPNHNFKPWETPIKVGMPINGQSFNKLWTSLLRHDHIWAGDMTAFDSSLPPQIIKMIAEIRKESYKGHFDNDRVSLLIDLCYDTLIEQPLGFKAWGEIAKKHKGLSTGHSSTTPDNSLAVIICYLLAWRRITGLRCREFFNYNTLTNFGDDHLLGWDNVFGWTPHKASEVMASFGVTMRDEGEGEDKLPDIYVPDAGKSRKIKFLSKMPLALTTEIKTELSQYNIEVPLTYATCHDKEKLIGKIKGQIDLAKDAAYKHQRLISFLYLCPHHLDVFERLSCIIAHLEERMAKKWKIQGYKPQKKPSYGEIMRKWYEKGNSEKIIDMEDREIDEHDNFIFIHENNFLDYFVRWLSDVPTMLSPRYENTRWADWIQHKTSHIISWPFQFINIANVCFSDMKTIYDKLSRTPYNFIRTPIIDINPTCNYTTLFIRHYLFMLYVSIFGKQRYGFSILDYIRVFDHSYINLLFMITGQVTTILVELDLHIIDICVISLLSYVNFKRDFLELPIKMFLKYEPLAPSTFVGWLLTCIVKYYSPAGSIDYQSLIARLRLMNENGGFSCSAPTGSGKSTTMINRIHNFTRKKCVVIVPRRMVAIGVSNYMKELYPHSGIGVQTEGFYALKTDRIVYTTPQSFFLSKHLQHKDHFIILDEAHVNEPSYIMVSSWLRQTRRNFIFMTATPRNDWGLEHLEIPAVSGFKIVNYDIKCKNEKDYIDKVVGFINSMDNTEKQLVFCPTIALQQVIYERLLVPAVIINSKNLKINNNPIILTTSISDAGVTIPDVAYVHSMDVELDFHTDIINHRLRTTNPPYYLDHLTRKQRAGRTGRTCNGIFYYYHVEQFQNKIPEREKKSFTYEDFVLHLGPSIQDFKEYIPPNIHPTNIDKMDMENEFEQLTSKAFAKKYLAENYVQTNVEVPSVDDMVIMVDDEIEAIRNEDAILRGRDDGLCKQGVKYFEENKLYILNCISDYDLYKKYETYLVNYRDKVNESYPFKTVHQWLKQPQYREVDEFVKMQLEEEYNLQKDIASKDLEVFEISNLPDPDTIKWEYVSGVGFLCGPRAVTLSMKNIGRPIDLMEYDKRIKAMIDPEVLASALMTEEGYDNPESFYDPFQLKEALINWRQTGLIIWNQNHRQWILDKEECGNYVVIKLDGAHYWASSLLITNYNEIVPFTDQLIGDEEIPVGDDSDNESVDSIFEPIKITPKRKIVLSESEDSSDEEEPYSPKLISTQRKPTLGTFDSEDNDSDSDVKTNSESNLESADSEESYVPKIISTRSNLTLGTFDSDEVSDSSNEREEDDSISYLSVKENPSEESEKEDSTGEVQDTDDNIDNSNNLSQYNNNIDSIEDFDKYYEELLNEIKGIMKDFTIYDISETEIILGKNYDDLLPEYSGVESTQYMEPIYLTIYNNLCCVDDDTFNIKCYYYDDIIIKHILTEEVFLTFEVLNKIIKYEKQYKTDIFENLKVLNTCFIKLFKGTLQRIDMDLMNIVIFKEDFLPPICDEFYGTTKMFKDKINITFYKGSDVVFTHDITLF